MKTPIPIRVGLLLSVTLLGACTSLSKQVYVASDTSLGVNGAVNTAQTAGKLVIGYDRKFVAYVPKINYEGDSDVMAVYNCTHLEVQGLRITAFRERLATGDAATIADEGDPQGKGGNKPPCAAVPSKPNNPAAVSATSTTTQGESHGN